MKETVQIQDATVVRVTDRALLCEIEGEEFWIPKAHIDDDSEITVHSEDGDEGELIIPLWFAEEQGLI